MQQRGRCCAQCSRKGLRGKTSCLPSTVQGASILDTSPRLPFSTQARLDGSAAGSGRAAPVDQPASAALAASARCCLVTVDAGACWAMEGWGGWVTVKLLQPLIHMTASVGSAACARYYGPLASPSTRPKLSWSAAITPPSRAKGAVAGPTTCTCTCRRTILTGPRSGGRGCGL